jgi:hypothetical protein
MSPEDVADTIRRRLAAELETDRAAIESLGEEIAKLAAPGQPGDETMRAPALAFQLERFYTAVEAAITRVLRRIDGDVPAGSASHFDVLRAGLVAVEGVRPAVVEPGTANELEELLRFRHVARHAYGSPLDLRRLRELASIVERLRPQLATSLVAFERWLRGEGR